MRITRETLIKLATDTAAQRVRLNRRVVCIYLTGSLVNDQPLLGGTGDIDLIFIHDSEPPFPREVVHLTDEIHLDIGHYSQGVFRQPRHLRLEPWLGSFICTKPLVLHDTQHWFEFTQASIFSQFYDPSNVAARARPLAEDARQSWVSLHSGSDESYPARILGYLNALKKAGNSIALLTGTPLTERRFLLQFPQRAQALQKPDLSARLIDLAGGQDVPDETWLAWLEKWKAAFSAAAAVKNSPARLHIARLPYYERAASFLWDEHPAAAIWPILNTWTEAVSILPEGSTYQSEWLAALETLKLDKNSFYERLQALDEYLDLVEETLDGWSQRNGIQP